MAKAKTQYVCQDCGHSTPRWAGQCSGCREWNTLVEEAVPSKVKAPVMRSGLSSGGAASGSAPRMAVLMRPQLACVGQSERMSHVGASVLRRSRCCPS